MTVWLPLESNPDSLTTHMRSMGVSNKWSIVDVVGLEAEVLEWIPKPVKAIILLFPYTRAYVQHRSAEYKRLRDTADKYPPNLYYMRQLTYNACGTIALIHAIANNLDSIDFNHGAVLKEFLRVTRHFSAEHRGEALGDADMPLDDSYEIPEDYFDKEKRDDNTCYHYAALVNNNGHIYEMDGRKAFPIDHGPTTPETFGPDALRICKEFMQRDPGELHFTILALVPTLV